MKLLEMPFNTIKLSTFGAATSVADMRLKSHPLAIYSLNLMVLEVPFITIKLRTYLPPSEVETLVPQSHKMGHFWWN
ncbi:MAG: hypothetical protein DRN17_08040 [Thermoplasmata archaeon]|nr:MAG: hypothetical protein DRN17_08040 [Thermoplasmata archaeon]